MMTANKEAYPKYAPGTHVSTKDIVNKNVNKICFLIVIQFFIFVK